MLFTKTDEFQFTRRSIPFLPSPRLQNTPRIRCQLFLVTPEHAFSPKSSCRIGSIHIHGQFARVVKGVDLRSTAGNCTWVRTPQLTLPNHFSISMPRPYVLHLAHAEFASPGPSKINLLIDLGPAWAWARINLFGGWRMWRVCVVGTCAMSGRCKNPARFGEGWEGVRQRGDSNL